MGVRTGGPWALALIAAAAFSVASCGWEWGLDMAGSQDQEEDSSTPSTPSTGSFYEEVELATGSTNSNLVGPRGIAAGGQHPFLVANTGSGRVLGLDKTGSPSPAASPFDVSIPSADSGESGTPIGAVFSRFAFTVGEEPSTFIFVSRDGSVSSWLASTTNTNAIRRYNPSSPAVYTGAAIGTAGTGNTSFLYVTNFSENRIDVFNSNFQRVDPAQLTAFAADAFVEQGTPAIPDGFAPFGIANMDGQLYVTYAKQDAAKDADDAGPGNGYVSVFETSGAFVRRVASNDVLNSPWGLAVAPTSFGTFSNALLVGNHGDGRIQAYDLNTGELLDHLESAEDDPIEIPGLWGLIFGNDAAAGDASTLYFTADGSDGTGGGFGSIQVR